MSAEIFTSQSHPLKALTTEQDRFALREQIRVWGRELGFQQIGFAQPELAEHEQYLQAWIDNDYHGEMSYMAGHGHKRSRPNELVEGTQTVITARMDYLPADIETTTLLSQKDKAYISRYALGRDYHKLIRKRLTQLAKQIEQEIKPLGYRAFVDSAPLLERALATRSGLGWIGKNTMLIHPKAGSFFFLGEILIDLALPVDQPYPKDHCGSCRQCHLVCPTQAFVGDKLLDARRCISYLTIELKGAIPEPLRKGIGNRIFGCDDCQLACPWNRFSQHTQETDFSPRHNLDRVDLVELFAWDEETFLSKTEGTPIRRAGYERWLRNIAVALGNAPTSNEVLSALNTRLDHESPLVQEHVLWALHQHQ
ncbi:epoxyqueuosine reductase [Oceanospirillum multiglobuliferum]|uniref:Epoxyqueuosine reductase n=1 Tax=Oceanospirillum multiglobuliferum TaxID=64969 RepID=A0A1T4RIJ1_9GAMM|nr:tRNA epoxyqueuosine(34) reductase QueG [Oceanospirillum multiglobuliferum]OPX54785.1 tRNA epoxyqueuosine(34) reductase QueG [Oceanospirillum multiglobuliferum]SKA15511.1 epoxyqueuosine reductase [Oceanospirillum multiglobuliferum]